MKKILIINHYAGCPKYGMEFRHYNIAKELIKKGHEVTIVASSFTHLRKEPKNYTEKIDGIRFFWIKTTKYKKYGLGRFLNMVLFSLKMFFIRDFLFIPDTIIVSSPSPFPIINAIKLKKKYKAKLIYEIRDVWPKTIIELNGTSPNNPVMRLIDWLDSLAIKNSDLILSPLANIKDYIKEKGYNKNVVIIPNGIKQSKIHIESNGSNNKFTIGYGGTISNSNSIINLIKAANILKEEKDIEFKIVGSGNKTEDMKEMINKEGLKNIKLYGRKPQKELFSILNSCDVLYKGNPKKDIYKYGISSIKMVEYLLLQKPILDASYGVNIVQESKCGLSVPYENPEELAKGILRMKQMHCHELKQMALNGYDYVLKNYLYENSVKKLIQAL